MAVVVDRWSWRGFFCELWRLAGGCRRPRRQLWRSEGGEGVGFTLLLWARLWVWGFRDEVCGRSDCWARWLVQPARQGLRVSWSVLVFLACVQRRLYQDSFFASFFSGCIPGGVLVECCTAVHRKQQQSTLSSSTFTLEREDGEHGKTTYWPSMGTLGGSARVWP